MTPSNPYLVRAIHQWLSDNDDIPHILVDTNKPGVVVPKEYIENDLIVLNISYGATKSLQIANEMLSFETRFSGKSHSLQIPISSIKNIYGLNSKEGLELPPIEEPEVSKTPNLKLV